VCSSARANGTRFQRFGIGRPSAQPAYMLTVVELVALRRVAPRPAAQRLAANGAVRAVPPLHAAGLSQRDNRYHGERIPARKERGGKSAVRTSLPLQKHSPTAGGEFRTRDVTARKNLKTFTQNLMARTGEATLNSASR